MAEKVRVAIGIFCLGQRTAVASACVQAGLDVVGSSGLLEDLWRIVVDQKPNIVILSWELPNSGDGEEVARKIFDKFPLIRVINYSEANWGAHISLNPRAARGQMFIEILKGISNGIAQENGATLEGY